ncbi:bifunctional phosphopantothenoylcysteine decarboxylase/phosphopantothenate--cysteine ligase CoaBC [Acidithiobacillus sp.]|uniref:bifunctional phosphopantothenoylcysteine decarboxylase/phosphopantothenate--cysteine ligase CoaBC n=1 Tax=Acidithiobacillus sp. TaxID=1872118 RepID=UPI0025BB9795|nr:bifunctional phosphopantothenoylcysteine decarboxylase/phosphopantothenate--cysteine ligase CoaBC [Acidithiobacillus sp.]
MRTLRLMTVSAPLNCNAPLHGKRILLLVGGSIAAYKSPEIVRLLRAEGAELRCVLSAAASRFVTPLTLQALSGEAPRQDLFAAEEEAAMDHIRLARWPDALLYAPISANGLAKLALGLADDLGSTVALASRAPRYLAPAMNTAMWEHPATQRHVAQLRTDGAYFIDPEQGVLACGENGAGRLAEPSRIVEHLRLGLGPQDWRGRRVLVSAGPTWEAIDPVRALTNRASGRQGFALAQAAAERGARVVLVAGPCALPTPLGVQRHDVVSAQEMLATILRILEGGRYDLFLANAAVADHRPTTSHAHKRRKGELGESLAWIANPDIVATVHESPHRPRRIVAFAAETAPDIASAAAKLRAKGADVAIVNDVSEGAMGGNENACTLVCGERVTSLPLQDKLCLSRALLRALDPCLR